MPKATQRKQAPRTNESHHTTNLHMLANNELILQNNLHKSKERTHGILNDPDTKEYAILFLQEQYWSDFTKSSPIHHSWSLYEPPTVNSKQPCTAIYINNDHLTNAQTTQGHTPLTDVTAVRITTQSTGPLLVVNIYNPCDEPIILELHSFLREHVSRQKYDTVIMAGDFNCHHPLWNPREYTTQDEDADALVVMAAELGLNLLIPAGSITYPNTGTAIDLVWGNNEAARKLIKCRIATDHDQGSDHLSIETTLAVRTEATQLEAQYNYMKTKWEEFDSKLTALLQSPTLAAPQAQQIASCSDLDTYTEQLTDAITKAVQDTTPHKKWCPHSKRWWNEKLTEIHREANRLRNTYRRTGHHADKQAWRVKANEYTTEIIRAKAAKWKEYVDSADAKTI